MNNKDRGFGQQSFVTISSEFRPKVAVRFDFFLNFPGFFPENDDRNKDLLRTIELQLLLSGIETL